MSVITITMQDQTGQCILVTGGAGFIGSNFVELAVDKGYRVIVLDALTYAGHKENLDLPHYKKQVELVVGNICDPQLVTKLLKDFDIDAVINFAAESHVDRSIDGPSIFIETNINGTFNLLNGSLAHWKARTDEKRNRFRYLQVSTDEVYGSLGPQGKFSETTPYSPNSPYSSSKAAADHLVRAWHHTYGLPTLTTNCSNNYGPRQFPEKLIPTMIHCALSGKPLPVYGDGGNVRDWIHVQDHCAGIFQALHEGTPGKTYCFGGNAEHGNLDVVRTICRQLDQLKPRADGKHYETGIQFVADRLGHDRRYAIDDSLAQNELGFKRKYNFEQGLAHTIRWYLENQSWTQAVLSKGTA
jgi:dTDP-glucose 4,6-dehydratase